MDFRSNGAYHHSYPSTKSMSSLGSLVPGHSRVQTPQFAQAFDVLALHWMAQFAFEQVPGCFFAVISFLK